LIAVAGLSQIVNFTTGKPVLELDPSVDSILPKEDENRAYLDYMKEMFVGGEVILIALEDDDIFTTENLTLVQQISEEIEQFEEISRVSSLSMALNIRSEEGSLIIQPFYDFPPETPEEIDDLRQRALADPIYSGNLVSPNGKVTVIMVHLLDIPEKDLLAKKVDGRINSIVEKYWQHGERWVTGSAHVKAEMSNVMIRDVSTVVPAALIIMALIAGISFRTLRGIFVPLGSVAISVIITLGFISVFYHSLNQVTVVVPSLLIVVGFAYSIHIMSTYYDALRQNKTRNQDKPTGFVLNHVAAPVVYTGITTSAGFFALTTSPLTAIKEFGIGAGVGVLITMVVSLTFAPAILHLLPVPKKIRDVASETWMDRFFVRLAKFDIRNSRNILIIGGIFAVLSLVSIPKIQIGTDMVNSFKEDSDIRQDFYAVNDNLQGANSFYIIFETTVMDGFKAPENLRVIEDLQQWLEQQPDIGGSTSLVDYIKIINQGIGGSKDYYRIPDRASLVDELLFIGSNDEISDFIDFDYQMARVVVRTSAMDSRDLMDLATRVEDYLASNTPKHLSARVTGNSYLIAKTMDDIAIGQATSIATAFIIIYLILVLLFTSFQAGLIALIPNMIPVLIYFGILGWTGVQLNITTGLVACIVLGIAVDDTIHLMAKFNRAAKESANIDEGVIYALKHVGRPVTCTTMALCLGFLCLVMSEMRTQVEFGLLAAVTLMGAWIVDVTFTPAIAGRMKIVSLWDVLSLDLGEKPHLSIPFFKGLTATQARITALMANIAEYNEGEQVFVTGDVGSHMYVVIEGKLGVTINTNEEDSVFIDTLGRGDIVGEVALYHGERTANVRAMSNVRLLEITKQDLEDIQKRHPKIAAILYSNLNEVFAGRVANLATHIHA
jgi:predicted RND superfamily exporter protein